MLTQVKPAFQLKDMSLFRQQCYIDGQWVDADDKTTLAVNNPADGLQIGTVPKMGAAETRRAIEARPAYYNSPFPPQSGPAPTSALDHKKGQALLPCDQSQQ